MNQRYQALLIGHGEGLMLAIPGLLGRAGFAVDVLTSSLRFTSQHARRLRKVPAPELLVPAALTLDLDPYDLVVIADDTALREIMEADMPDVHKLRLLPIFDVEGFRHVGSKVGLSHVLKDAGISTPAFSVIYDETGLDTLVANLSEPVMLKVDQSGGGAGVFLIDPAASDVPAFVDFLKHKPLVFPLLVQQHIEGDLLDLSSFYQYGELVCASHSVVDAVVSNAYGPSSVRTYSQLSTIPEDVFQLLRDLGRALSAHGFVNIACMREAKTGKHYIIEADMRATVWVDYDRYLGDDHAVAIRRYFDGGQTLMTPLPLHPQYPEKRRIPYVFRLTPWAILTNAHRVWSYCDMYPLRHILRYCLSSSVGRLVASAVTHLKPRVKASHWLALRSAWHVVKGLGRQFI